MSIGITVNTEARVTRCYTGLELVQNDKKTFRKTDCSSKTLSLRTKNKVLGDEKRTLGLHARK